MADDTGPADRALRAAVDEVAARTGFSGAVRVDTAAGPVLAAAYGLAQRGPGIAATVDTRFAVASASKGFTALTVVSLVAQGALSLATTARSLLGDDLPLVADDVTVEHLLRHRSGIGDYLDEDVVADVDAYVLAVPAHRLAATADYLQVLDGHPTAFPAGQRFAYCNGGYVVLALLAERASGRSFHDLVQERVCAPAGMVDTAYLRSDELPGRTALGYLAGGDRTNVFHLPVRGSGDGGAYSTLADVHALWAALFAGRIVPAAWVERLVSPSPGDGAAQSSSGYGLGFWLPAPGVVQLEGCDAGVSFRSRHHRAGRRPGAPLTWTVVSNTSDGAWPVAALVADRVEDLLERPEA